MRRVLVPALVVTALVAGCSSSTTRPSATASSNEGIGQTKPASSQGPESTAALGVAITRGSLRITMAGPVTATKTGDGLEVQFNVTMTNTAPSGDVDGPENFMVRCDADRDAKNDTFGSYWATTTAAGKTISAGKTVTGIAVVSWLKWNSTVRCTGPTTIEAQWPLVGYLAWTLPADVVAQVNKAGGV